VGVQNNFEVARVELEKPMHKTERKTARIDEEELNNKEDYQIRKQLMEERKRVRELYYIERFSKKESETKGEELKHVGSSRRREFDDKLHQYDTRVAEQKKQLQNERQERREAIVRDDDEVDQETLLHWNIRDTGKKKELEREKQARDRQKKRKEDTERINQEWAERKKARAIEDERIKKFFSRKRKKSGIRTCAP